MLDYGESLSHGVRSEVRLRFMAQNLCLTPRLASTHRPSCMVVSCRVLEQPCLFFCPVPPTVSRVLFQCASQTRFKPHRPTSEGSLIDISARRCRACHCLGEVMASACETYVRATDSEHAPDRAFRGCRAALDSAHLAHRGVDHHELPRRRQLRCNRRVGQHHRRGYLTAMMSEHPAKVQIISKTCRVQIHVMRDDQPPSTRRGIRRTCSVCAMIVGGRINVVPCCKQAMNADTHAAMPDTWLLT